MTSFWSFVPSRWSSKVKQYGAHMSADVQLADSMPLIPAFSICNRLLPIPAMEQQNSTTLTLQAPLVDMLHSSAALSNRDLHAQTDRDAGPEPVYLPMEKESRAEGDWNRSQVVCSQVEIAAEFLIPETSHQGLHITRLHHSDICICEATNRKHTR